MDRVAALYARVSSDHQAQEGTIGSQVAALRARIGADGLQLLPGYEFLDEGHSGATLLRPGLERLRDVAATGVLDRLYVHAPDRLARKYAYQVLLLEELERAGVEVLFLSHELGRSPEDDLLLQVQGMIAEYERARITERSRRGKRHQASQGAISVLGAAPYGYRYVPKHEGAGAARYEIVLEEARVVRQLFTWIGRERLTLGQVQRRLAAEGVPSPGGKPTWSRGTIRQLVANPAYAGQAAYGKTRNGPYVPPLRRYQGRPAQPRRPVSARPVPQSEWIPIPVPAIVPPEVMAAVSEQLAENCTRARERATGPSSLLQGLLCCACCGYAYVSMGTRTRRSDGTRPHYRYYRCSGTEPRRFGGARICTNRAIPLDLAEALVWGEVRAVLEDPNRLRAEYERRLHHEEEGASAAEQRRLETQRRRLLQGRERLIDSYAEGLLESADFTPRITRLRARLVELETQLEQAREETEWERELRAVIGQMDEFAARVADNLGTADEETKRSVVRSLVKRVEIDADEIHVVFRIPGSPDGPARSSAILQHWTSRSYAGPPYGILMCGPDLRVLKRSLNRWSGAERRAGWRSCGLRTPAVVLDCGGRPSMVHRSPPEHEAFVLCSLRSHGTGPMPARRVGETGARSASDTAPPRSSGPLGGEQPRVARLQARGRTECGSGRCCISARPAGSPVLRGSDPPFDVSEG